MSQVWKWWNCLWHGAIA